MAKCILGLAGEMATGKGTVAKYITEKYSGHSFRFSTMLRDVLKRLYIPEKRENIQKISTSLRENYGEDLFAKVMYEDVKKDTTEVIVIDGVRRHSDTVYLKKLPEFKLIYLEVNINNSYARMIKRAENENDEKKTFEEFKKEHEHESELQIRELKKEADFVVDNNGTLEELYAQVDSIIGKCKD